MCVANEKAEEFLTHMCTAWMWDYSYLIPQECWAGHGSSGQDMHGTMQ